MKIPFSMGVRFHPGDIAGQNAAPTLTYSCYVINRRIPQLTFTFSELRAREFFDGWIGQPGLFSWLGRLIFRLSGKIYARTFIREAQLAATDRVLELGCGLGTILIASQRRVQSREIYVGIDLSNEMIRHARVNRCRSVFPGQIEFVLSSAIALPFCNGSFDVVLLSHLVKYFTDIQLGQVLAEARRVLHDRGKIVLWEFRPFLSRRVSELIAKKVGGQKLRSTEEICHSLEAAGFRDLTPFRIVTPWVPWRNVALCGRAYDRVIQAQRA